VDSRADGSKLTVVFNDIADTVQSVQRWGNRRANLYWEKHLKAGHVPPDQSVILIGDG
jgi:hypothetical protein